MTSLSNQGRLAALRLIPSGAGTSSHFSQMPSWSRVAFRATSVAAAASSSTAAANVVGKRYSINYHMLKDSGVLGGKAGSREILQAAAPSTVTDNVKNVQGWRGAAKRGFMGAYPDCIHQITARSSPYGVNDWCTKILTHYLSSAYLPERHGLLVPVAYYQIRENGPSSSSSAAAKMTAEMEQKRRTVIREEMKSAHVLGWAVELARASSILASDTITAGSGSHQDNGQVIHHARFLSHDLVNQANGIGGGNSGGDAANLKKLNYGAVAFSDAMILRNSVYALVSANFAGTPTFPHILSDFLESFETLSVGQAALLKLSSANLGKERLSQLDVGTYKRVIRTTVIDSKFILPVRLALHLGGLSDPKAHAQAQNILTEIGYLVEITGDFANCFYDTEGKDIEEGRLTWLIVNAYQRASPSLKEALEENYGKYDSSKAAVVKQVYEDLKLKRLGAKVIEDSREGILTSIQQLSTVAGLPPKFFFALLDNMDNLS